jgi:hypothetical protein
MQKQFRSRDRIRWDKKILTFSQGKDNIFKMEFFSNPECEINHA